MKKQKTKWVMRKSKRLIISINYRQENQQWRRKYSKMRFKKMRWKLSFKDYKLMQYKDEKQKKKKIIKMIHNKSYFSKYETQSALGYFKYVQLICRTVINALFRKSNIIASPSLEVYTSNTQQLRKNIYISAF